MWEENAENTRIQAGDHYTFSHTTSQDGTWVAAGEFIVHYATWTPIYIILNRLINENKKKGFVRLRKLLLKLLNGYKIKA